MSIELKKEVKNRLLGSIQKYFQENMDEEIGDLKSILLFEFIVKEIGPVIYNQAISDAQSVLQNNINELDSVCYEPEERFLKKK